MRVHRLRVTDFRGVVDREITFADTGVTVIEGENEAGKSTMVEALDLLLTTRADSTRARVRAVQPAGRDVGSTVTAEITCGDHRFEYRKRFNKAPETTLTILSPAPEQLTGRTAHERVEQILAGSLDSTLYRALRLLQSSDPELGDLTDSSALSRALDRAAGQVDDAADSPEAQELVAAVTREYQRYFTAAQGRPSGELLAARTAADEAAAAVAERERLLASVQEATDALPQVVAQIHELEELESQQRVEVSTLAARVAEADAAGERSTAAKAVVDRCSADHRTRLGQAESEIATTANAVADARAGAQVAAQRAAATAERILAVQTELDNVRAWIEHAEAAARVEADRAGLAELDATIAEVTEGRTTAENARAEAAQIAATPDDTAEAVRLDREIAAARARLDAGAPTVVVTALDGFVTVDGEVVADEHRATVATAMTVESSSMRVVVTPGADAQALADDLARLETEAGALAQRCGVESITAIAAAAARRTELLRLADDADAAVARALAGRELDDVRIRRAELAARVPETPPTVGEGGSDLVALRSRERELTEAANQAQRERDAELSREHAERTKAQAWEESGETARVTAGALRELLLVESAATPDAVLDEAVATAEHALEEARTAYTKVTAEAATIDGERVRAAHADAEAALDRIRTRLDRQRRLQTELSTRIEVCRDDGRLDELSDAVAANEAAQATLRRVTERAEGARVLHETLQRKRAESRARYVDPFTRRLEELAAPVFGDGVRFTVGDDFQISSRTLDGVTVDIEALSGGAREQVGLLARLACASLVDEADGVPVILDDALGYTDPKRLAAMSSVIGAAGPGAQIIVLTCTPDRYREVENATSIAV